MTTIEQKRQLLELAEFHQRADEFEQGNPKMCSVGCSVADAQKLGIVPADKDPYSHETIAELWNVPTQIAHLFDAIFEGLPVEKASEWTPRWQRAILASKSGKHSLAWNRFALWLLTESALLCITDVNRDAIAAVAELHRRVIAGESVSESDWSAAYSAAYSAACSAAYSAACSAACSAAYSAADSAADSAACSAAWVKMSDKLVEILAE